MLLASNFSSFSPTDFRFSFENEAYLKSQYSCPLSLEDKLLIMVRHYRLEIIILTHICLLWVLLLTQIRHK